MPNTANLVSGGYFSPMYSSVPEISSVAWSSLVTACNPAQHGIFGFMETMMIFHQKELLIIGINGQVYQSLSRTLSKRIRVSTTGTITAGERYGESGLKA